MGGWWWKVRAEVGSAVKPVKGDGTMVVMVRVQVEVEIWNITKIFRVLNIISRDAYMMDFLYGHHDSNLNRDGDLAAKQARVAD